MNIVSRITNQSAIDYYQITGSRRVADYTRSPGKRTKNEHSLAKGSLFRGFYSNTKLPAGKSSTSIHRTPDDNFISRTPNDVVNPSRSSVKEGLNQPRIRFDEYRINLKAEIFKFCLVGKFPTAVAGASLEQVKEMASGEWNLQGGCSITLLDQSHLFIRLENEVDMIRVWPRNQWSVNGEVMKVFKWTPMFRPSDEELPSAAVWVTLPSLPVVFYQEELLRQIVSLVGKVLGVDDSTKNLTKTDSARVCVEVDLLKELPSKVWIEVGAKGYWQAIEYEGKPCFCTNCSTVGHKASSCKKKIEKAAIDASEEDTSPFEFRKCDARVGNYHTTPLLAEIKRAHTLKGGSQIMGDERNTVAIVKNGPGSSQDISGQVLQSISCDKVIEVSEKYKQPMTKPVAVSGELLDAEETVNAHRSSKQDELEMGNRESVSKTQNQDNDDHGGSSSEAEEIYSIRNHRRKLNLWRRRLRTPENPLAPGFHIRCFSFSEMKKVCNSFRDVIGEGGFGNVYRGKLGKQKLAIKRWRSNSHQGVNEFERELIAYRGMGYCFHMVSLIGYCNDNGELILVYEYMSHGDLGKHLFDKNHSCLLSWAQRLIICIGAARGLHHLHLNAVIHRDVNPGNILVDHNWEAKLTDLGISKSVLMYDENTTHVSTRVMGTVGYVEPHYIATGSLTYESDIYSFGIVMLELMFGRRAFEAGHSNLDVWRKSCRRENILQADIAPELKGKVSVASLKEYSALALKCLADKQSDRPGMKEVIDKLEFILQLQQDHEGQ